MYSNSQKPREVGDEFRKHLKQVKLFGNFIKCDYADQIFFVTLLTDVIGKYVNIQSINKIDVLLISLLNIRHKHNTRHI